VTKPAKATSKKQGAPSPGNVSPVNREAIRVLTAWSKRAPLHDAAFWRDFEADLRASRMTLRKRA